MNLRESTLRQRSVVDSRLGHLFSSRGDLNNSLSYPVESLNLNPLQRHQKSRKKQQQQAEISLIHGFNLVNNGNSRTTFTRDGYSTNSNIRKQDMRSPEEIGRDKIVARSGDSRESDSSSAPICAFIKKRRYEIAIVDSKQTGINSIRNNNNNHKSNMSSLITLNSQAETTQIADSHCDLNNKLYLIERDEELSECDINRNSTTSSSEEQQRSKRIKRKSIRDAFESHKLGGELICSCNEKFDEKQLPIEDERNHLQEEEEVDSETANNQPPSPTINYGPIKGKIFTQQHKLVSLGERNGRSICNKHMPWFGIDVGGSLIKVVFFDPKEATREETVTLKRIRRYLRSSKPYGTTGKRDTHLEMTNCIINKRFGSLHFIRFATSQMPEFLKMAKNKRFTDTINTVCATGGGAYKFEDDIKRNLGITLHKTDELDSIIYGIHYIDKYNSAKECYYLEDPLDDEKCIKVPYDFSRPYPYLVVNIGSGVSILAVYSSTSYSRISGSSIGGGTFLGLCSLLTQCKTFDEAIQLAKAGSSSKIDKLVKDIYGGDYPKFNLSGDTVASSFGHMNMAEKRKDVKREDLARALLEMVTINIGSIARMCAANENIDRVVFIGNFLRVNQLSMKLLSYAVNYWSKGAMKALFLEHEGYFGAVGCFVESTRHLG